jgi:hypothetical protein
MILSIALIIIAAFAKAVKDLCASGGLSWGAFWDEKTAHAYKWKHGDENLGEAFPGSSTIFVGVTSGFHLAQLFEYTAIFILIVTYEVQYSALIDFFIARATFGLLFEYAFYRPLKG